MAFTSDNVRLVSLTVNLRVTDVPLFRSHAATLWDDALGDQLGDLIPHTVVNPRKAPLTAGYEIMESSATCIEAEDFRLKVVARVFDEDAFNSEAVASYTTSWGEPPNDELTESGALFEILIGSNGNPAPLDMGYELISWWTPDSSLASRAGGVAMVALA